MKVISKFTIMSLRDFFSFQPLLKPYIILPAKDSSTEFIIVLDENGAALGITAMERRILPFFDGTNSIGNIASQLLCDKSNSLSNVRTLLWDLDRYGFLQKSPWFNLDHSSMRNCIHSSKHCSYYRISSLLGSLDIYWGRVLS